MKLRCSHVNFLKTISKDDFTHLCSPADDPKQVELLSTSEIILPPTKVHPQLEIQSLSTRPDADGQSGEV